MSQPTPTSVECRQCHTQQPFTCWESINVTLDARLKEEFLSGRLKLLFASVTNEGDQERLEFALVGEQDEASFDGPRAVYVKLATALAPALARPEFQEGEWRTVDETFALRLMGAGPRAG